MFDYIEIIKQNKATRDIFNNEYNSTYVLILNK